MPQRKLREIVGDRKLLHVAPDMTVDEACQEMGKHFLTAVLVLDGGQLCGIFTKRDLLSRVVNMGLDPKTAPIADAMTANPIVMDAGRLGLEAVRAMRDEKIRHMVVSGLDGDGYGVICLGDIGGSEFAAFENELNFENKVWEEI